MVYEIGNKEYVSMEAYTKAYSKFVNAEAKKGTHPHKVLEQWYKMHGAERRSKTEVTINFEKSHGEAITGNVGGAAPEKKRFSLFKRR